MSSIDHIKINAIIRYFDRKFYKLFKIHGVCKFRVMEVQVAPPKSSCSYIPEEHILFNCEVIVTGYFEEDISYLIATHLEGMLYKYFNYYPRVEVRSSYVGS
jgi:hypothetical protein